jgi:hypothetical protein
MSQSQIVKSENARRDRRIIVLAVNCHIQRRLGLNVPPIIVSTHRHLEAVLATLKTAFSTLIRTTYVKTIRSYAAEDKSLEADLAG